MSASIRVRLLGSDSQHFGVTIGRLEPSIPRELTAAHHWCARNKVDTAHLLVTASSVALIERAEEHAFDLVDVRIELRAPTKRGTGAPASDVAVRGGRIEDLPALTSIARRAHRGGRFHADARLGGDLADALYVAWVRSSLDREDAELLVAERKGVPVGYVVWSLPPTGTAWLELIAVHELARREGIGESITTAVLDRAAARGASECHVVTQAGNVGAQQLYATCNFRFDQAGLWYHRWYRKGP